VCVDDIGRASPREQLAYPLAVIPAQCAGERSPASGLRLGADFRTLR